MWPEMVCFLPNERSNLTRELRVSKLWILDRFLSKDVKYFEAESRGLQNMLTVTNEVGRRTTLILLHSFPP